MLPSLQTCRIAATAILSASVLTGCLPTFDVDVNTPEPIKVDLAMDVHVYQHGEEEDDAENRRNADYRTAMNSRRNRMAEIQELKNNRLVGENHLAELSIRNKPAGEYGDYVVETVREENEDREILMRFEAEEEGVSISQIREEQWRHWQRKSFPGEWIEVEDNGSYRWIRKPSTTEE